MDAFEWIEEQVRRQGLWKVIGAPFVLLSAVASVASFFGNLTTGIIVVLAVALVVAVVILSLEFQHARRLRSDHDELRRALGELRRYVLTQHQPNCFYSFWRDEFSVSQNGDLSIVRRLTVRVDPPSSPLHFLEYVQAGERLSQAERRRMRFLARQEPGGASLPIDIEWDSEREAHLWIHLNSPLQPGDPELKLIMECDWPHSLPKLGRGGKERLFWECLRPTDRLEYLIVLDKSFRRTGPIRYGLSGLPNNVTQRHEAGTWRIEGYAAELPQGAQMTLALDASL